MPQKNSRHPLPVKLWPEAERPRERLFRLGVGALSDAEILALFLRVGRRGTNVRDLARELLAAGGGLNGLARLSPTELTRFAGLGPAKAAAVAAAFDLGRRTAEERLRRQSAFSSAREALPFLHHLFRRERDELFVGLLLNAKNELLSAQPLARGGPARVAADLPRLLRRLLTEGAAAVIFAHNHPSGDPTPSGADRRVTVQLRRACRTVDVLMHDHLIVGHRRAYSFAEKGLVRG